MKVNGNGNGNGHHPRWWHSLRRKRHPATAADSASYQRLALQLHYDLPRADCGRSVLLVAPAGSMACAQAGLGLAAALAGQRARPVLLVDACPTSPDTTHLVGGEGEAGLADFLADPASSLSNLVLPTTIEHVHFLPAGKARPLVHDRIDALLAAAAHDYDFVLLAGGSVLNDALAMALAPSVQCVLLVVIENETRVEDLDAARSTLGYCKARKVGMLLTTPDAGD
jgi:Mrp family chromosome partitioning ATPase